MLTPTKLPWQSTTASPKMTRDRRQCFARVRDRSYLGGWRGGAKTKPLSPELTDKRDVPAENAFRKPNPVRRPRSQL